MRREAIARAVDARKRATRDLQDRTGRARPNRKRPESYRAFLSIEECAEVDRIAAACGGTQRDALMRAFALLAADLVAKEVGFSCPTCKASLVLSDEERDSLRGGAPPPACWRCGRDMKAGAA